nr:hypothetical protein CTI12_AA016560, mitochondrial [Tanacetum cinerariifolium]
MLFSKTEMGTMGMAFLSFYFCILFLSVDGNSEPSAYEVLKNYNLPIGVLPRGALGYTLDRNSGQFSVNLSSNCNVHEAGVTTSKLFAPNRNYLVGLRVVMAQGHRNSRDGPECRGPFNSGNCRHCTNVSFKDEPVYDSNPNSYNQTPDFSNPLPHHNYETNSRSGTGGNCPSYSIVGAKNEFVHDSNSFPYDNTPDFYDQPPQHHVETYSCELYGNDSYYAYDWKKIIQILGEMILQREQAANLSNHTPEPSRHFNSIYYDYDNDDNEKTIHLRDIISQLPSSIMITTSPPVLPIKDPEDSLIMGNEDLNTIPEKESNEVIKSSVQDLVPIPSESEDTSGSDNECDLPACDDFSPIDVPEGKYMTFTNPLFDSNDDFISSDDESLSNEDVSEDNIKIYSNPLFEFDDEYISSEINPFFDEVLEVIESKASYDSNLDEIALLVTPFFDSNEDECFDPGGDVDEINAFDTPLDFEDSYYDSEGDVLYLESLLSDDTTPNLPPKYSIDHQEDLNQQRMNDVDDRWNKMIESGNKIIQILGEMILQRKQAANLSNHTSEPSRYFNSIYYDDDNDDEEKTIPLRDIISQLPPSIVITTSPPVLPIEDPEDSLIMENEDLNTIPKKESNEVIESMLRTLFLSQNPLFEFDDEYISSDINLLFDEVLEDIESKASYDSNLDEPALLVNPLFDSNEDECFDLGGDVDEINTFDTASDFEDGYYDSEGDVLYLESLLSDDTILNLIPEAANLSNHTPEPSRHFNSIYYDDDNDDEEKTIPLRDIISRLPSSIVITTSPPVLPIKDPRDSLIMRNKDLNIIPEKELDEVIKSGVEDLVPIPSESEDTYGSDNDDFTSSDDESLSDEDVSEDNDIKSKYSYDSNLDEPALLVTPLFASNEDECFDPGGDVDEINAFDTPSDFEDSYYDSDGDVLYL